MFSKIPQTRFEIITCNYFDSRLNLSGIFKAKMQHIFWFQLIQYEDFMLFFLTYNYLQGEELFSD